MDGAIAGHKLKNRGGKILLTAAGFDPSAGAGVLRDILVFGRHGFHGVAIVTAITAQNTRGVKGVFVVSAARLEEQYKSLASDLRFSGIKVGMAGSKSNLRVLRKILASHPDIPRVIDPILRSSTGIPLLEDGAIPALLRMARKNATVITPNMNEAASLSGIDVRTVEDMRRASRALYDIVRIPCLVKGGHLEGNTVNLLFDGRGFHLFGRKKIAKDVHGTGCYFGASLLGYLAEGRSLVTACELATESVRKAIAGAVRIGRGRFVFDDRRACL
jgi:hydroxymethylpyrimidine/phosphomethylpyrimidine kinase